MSLPLSEVCSLSLLPQQLLRRRSVEECLVKCLPLQPLLGRRSGELCLVLLLNLHVQLVQLSLHLQILKSEGGKLRALLAH